ncbi:Mu transposase C-terminal domain-containing protein [Deinococcus altitudinis]|uniref:Mu transposase C-terminal domain-containing protein n=1 Tax=Deinococcus altitudinis TaxID=468914 RepID=UPI003891B869
MNDVAFTAEISQQTSHSSQVPTYGQRPLPAARRGVLYLPRLQVAIAFESVIEQKFLYVADADPRVVSVRRADSISYAGPEGTWHTYTPDFHVVEQLPQGKRCESVYECKPRDLLRNIIGNELLDWQLRQAVLTVSGLPLLVVTDHDLEGPRLEHALKFGSFFHSVPLPDLRVMVLNELAESRLALGELYSRLELRVPVSQQTVAWRLQLIDTVYAMIASGTLYADRGVLPDDACPIWRADQSVPTEVTPVGVPIATYIATSMSGWPEEPATGEPGLQEDPYHHLAQTQFLATARGQRYLKLFSLYNDPATSLGADLVECLCRETGLSSRSLFRFRKLLQAAGGGVTFDQLVPELAIGSHAPTNTVDPRVAEIIEQHLQKRYLAGNGTNGRYVTRSELHHEIRAACLGEDLSVPAKSTVNRAIELAYQQNPFGFTQQRSGQEEASKLLGRQGHYRATRYGELLAMDHTRCDVFIVDGVYQLKEVKKSGKPAAKSTHKAKQKATLRATMVVITEDATGEVVFSDLLSEPASAANTLDCLRRLMLGDHDVQLAAGVQVLPAFVGVPVQIRLDSGGEFDNTAVKQAIQALGITLIPRNKGTKHRGGREERTIGTLVRTQHTLPGTTMHSITARGEYQAQAGATLDLEQLSRFHQRNVEEYNKQPAPRQGQSRSDHAHALIKAGQVALRQPSPHQRRFLNERMLPFEERVCGRQGIEIFGLRYVSHTQEMDLLIQRRARVQVIYKPDDLRTVSLVHPDNGKLLILSAVSDFNVQLDVPLVKKDWDQTRKVILDQRNQLHMKRRSPQQIIDELRIQPGRGKKKLTQDSPVAPSVPDTVDQSGLERPAASEPKESVRRIVPTSLLTDSSPPILKA